MKSSYYLDYLQLSSILNKYIFSIENGPVNWVLIDCRKDPLRPTCQICSYSLTIDNNNPNFWKLVYEHGYTHLEMVEKLLPFI